MKRVLAVVSSAAAAGLLLAGCGTGQTTANTSGNSTNTNQAGSIDLSQASGTVVWAAPPITHTGLRKTLIDAFEKSHPNIHVQLQDQNSDTDTNRASLTTTIGGGSATPDVYMADVIWPAQFANAQLALSLDDKLPKGFWDRFSDGLVEGATYQGHIYAAPFFADTAFLFYRKDLLEKANLPVPTSWEQVEQEAKTLQQKGLVKYGFVWQGASYEGLTCDFMEYLADAGGRVLDDNGKPSLDSDAAKKALSFMRDLVQTGVSPKSEVTFKENDAMDAFNQGDAAFLRNWTYAWNNSQTPGQSKVVGKVGVVALPTFGGSEGYSCVGGWDLMVNPHTKNLSAALAFVDWMTGPDAQSILAKRFGEIPTNKQVAQDPSLAQLSPVFSVIPKVKFVPRPAQTPNYPQVSQAIYTNVNQALTGSVSVDDALKKAQQQVQSAVSGNGL
ncbi:MAG: ABC transporter substrate-binding protein [Alicyclobacillus macrosporangiidus]|uniref:ABC transporter substrate-binding protein n=1 Tax=Alicyclobacillus macrosporangiidus TaxID=392015 RepID=UPI0026F34341|nr:ABC transporter substrate-binding protein [Alicyclobacillus macrosporangiidus]MCL6598029.1 ABC transporter substrate-binding protein [Alicyclobacillus macrosporangiidus]